MKPVLQFIMTHLISLICGVVAIVAIVFGVLGMSASTVVDKMNGEISRIQASSIKSLRSKPQNEETIAKVKRRGEMFEAEYSRTLEEANRINRREVLMGGVFPKAEKTATPFEFKELYRTTVGRLWFKLDAGTLPTEVEIQEEEQNVADLLVLEAEQKAEEEDDDPGRPPAVAQRGSGRTRAVLPAARGRPGPPGGGNPRGGPGRPSSVRGPGGAGGGYSAPTVSSSEPKYNATYRARVNKAKSILCYYDQNTFHTSPIAYTDAAPTPEDMWYAQVGLWVQEDVVKAIAELNREAANRVTEGDPSVEHVPVKRLILVQVIGYEGGPEGRILFPIAGVTQSMQEVTAGASSLTGRKCNEQYDVVRFIVSVVVDQRETLELIDRISRANFYQCLSVSYEAVDHALETSEGYFYGTDPVVKLTLGFEGYMARDVYEEMMPSTVRAILGIEDKD